MAKRSFKFRLLRLVNMTDNLDRDGVSASIRIPCLFRHLNHIAISIHGYFVIPLLLLLPFWAQGQDYQPCSTTIVVADTVVLDDSVRFHLLPFDDVDSVLWAPDSLFANPRAVEQWITLPFDSSVQVYLTAYFQSANLFRWRKPGYVRSCTGYNYIDSPADGDLCQPRSISMASDPSVLCPDLPSNNYGNNIIISTDTLRVYGDSLPAFYNFDSAQGSILPFITDHLRRIPNDSAYVPFYVDTVDMWDPSRSHTHILNMNHFRLVYGNEPQAALPTIFFTVHIDDTAHHFFREGCNIPLCDTTLFYYGSIEFPRPGIPPSQSLDAAYYFNMVPRPHGRAIFRFYETPTNYYNTLSSICINRIEMQGFCHPTDNLMLIAPHPGCLVRDTQYCAVCPSQLPYTWFGHTFDSDAFDSITVTTSLCDSVHYLSLSVHFDDTLALYDTVVQNALPWNAYGHTFDSTGRYELLLSGTWPDCDTLLYYNLTVIDNVFDTTLTYICPGQLPYTLHGVTAYSDTVFNITLQGSQGQDSTVTYFVYVKADSDTAIFDTIVENQLPWAFLDSLFSDTVSNMPFHFVNEAGCDSIVYYNLHIFWNGDHCDSSLTFPNTVTPNGDGLNDHFVIGGLVENQCYPDNMLVIADRTGRIVFYAENICRDDQFWDPAASRIPAGTYFYRFVGRGINHATQHQGCIEILK